MQSNNPVFRNSDEFNGRTNAYGNQVYGGSGTPSQGYGQSDPSTWGVGTPGNPGATQATTTGPMTIDSVVQKTAIALFVVVAFAFATWVLTPALTANTTLSQDSLAKLFGAMTIGGLGAFALSMVNSFKRVISPSLVLVFCAFEGVALGAFSKYFDYRYGDGIIIQAVIGTFAAFAGTLAAYRFFDIQVSNKFRMGVVAGMFGLIGLAFLEVILSAFGAGLGVLGLGFTGLLFSIAGLVLGVFMLVLDFDFVENGVRAGLPERESWRAAFGLTVSLVWIYTNLLRILAIMRR